MNLTLRARVLLPVTRFPVENGALVIRDGRIAAVGAWPDVQSQAAGEVIDLGAVVLLPGLINSHCHLDYTDMAGELAPTGSFTDWIKCITTLKAAWSYTEFAQSWLNGAHMLLETGTTTVADIEAVPELLDEVWAATPLRVHSFLEMTGVKSRRNPRDILSENLKRVARARHSRNRLSLSPHAPYSTTPELLRLSTAAARAENRRLTTHIAESVEEFEMYQHGRGVMFDWLKRNERDMSDCGLGSPVQTLAKQGYLGEHLLAVHVNHLAPGDAQLLAEHQVHVAHCPRSHAYFKHKRFPRQELAAAGVNICLGTDSLATVPVRRGQPALLSMFEEMAALAESASDISGDQILQFATVNGARALGLTGQLGELAPGAIADVIALPYSGLVTGAAEAVVHHRGPVLASMIEGKWAIAPRTNR